MGLTQPSKCLHVFTAPKLGNPSHSSQPQGCDIFIITHMTLTGLFLLPQLFPTGPTPSYLAPAVHISSQQMLACTDPQIQV